MNDTVGDRSAMWAPDVHAWVAVDTHQRLLSVGRGLYPGVDPRSILSVAARHILLPRLWQALRDGRSRSEMTQFAGRFVDVAVVAVPGPLTGRPVAVLGCYGASASAFPALPRVAGMEWSVHEPGPAYGHRTGWVRDPWGPRTAPPGRRPSTVPTARTAGPVPTPPAGAAEPAVDPGQNMAPALDRALTWEAVRQVLDAPVGTLVLRHAWPADGYQPVRIAAWREVAGGELVRGTVTRLPVDARPPAQPVCATGAGVGAAGTPG